MADTQPSSTLFFYRWRYVLGYSLIGLLLACALLLCGLYLPGGLSSHEMSSVVESTQLSLKQPQSFAIINLPYYTLLRLSLHFFGVHDLSIKLPSLILALVSVIALVFLLRRWFLQNIAVLTALIAITTGQFLFVAQDATPSILYIFWPITLLLLGTLVSREIKPRIIWMLLFFIAAAFSVYTPLGVYPLLAMVLAAFLHPHLRHVIRRLPNWWLILGCIFAGIILTPLGYTVFHHPSTALSLLGVPPHWPNILTNVHTLRHQYFTFWQPTTTTLMTPVFGLGSVLLMCVGLYRLIHTRDTTQSYLLIIWVICLIPVLIFNPSYTTVTFLPAVLLLAFGLRQLISYWYRLFPRNPYARIAGLISLGVLVVTLVGSGLARYIEGYYYSPQIASTFSRDLAQLPNDTTNLVVAPQEQPFWQAVAHYRPTLTVTTTPDAGRYTVTHAAQQALPIDPSSITRIITTGTRENADRFYLYNK